MLTGFGLGLWLWLWLRPSYAQTKTLVVYAGPMAPVSGCTSKAAIHHDNFLFFLQHGLPTETEATKVMVVLVASTTTMHQYADIITRVKLHVPGVHFLSSNDSLGNCYDMGCHHTALTWLGGHRLRAFKYFLFLNCGLIGPFLNHSSTYWPSHFTNALNAQVKLTGLSLNCGGKKSASIAHVQSMLWATDHVGLQCILKSGAISRCDSRKAITKASREALIVRYELGLSHAVMNAGYTIAVPHNPLQHHLLYTSDNATTKPYSKTCRDLWGPQLMVDPEQMVFWKNSRRHPPMIDKRFRATAIVQGNRRFVSEEKYNYNKCSTHLKH